MKDETLRRACYTVRFMLADREDIRRAQYFNGGRIVIMAEYPLEKTTDVPVRVPKLSIILKVFLGKKPYEPGKVSLVT